MKKQSIQLQAYNDENIPDEYLHLKQETLDKFKHETLVMCLAKCSREGHSSIVSQLLRLIPEAVNETDTFRHTALYVAAKRNRQETVKILIEAKANPNVADTNGLTALMVAACLGNCDVCRCVIKMILKWEYVCMCLYVCLHMHACAI